MARIRTIKPDFWTDEALTECSLSARLLFIGTWNFADDAGNLDRSSKQIKARVFPIDNVDCEPLIQELMAQGLLIEYSVSGKKYLHIKGFVKHQVINRPSAPNCPSYEDSLSTQEDSRSTHAGRKEGKEEACSESKNKKPIPKDFSISDSVRSWAVANKYSHLEKRLIHFTGYALANGKKYVDWDRAFMNAIRDDWAKIGNKPIADASNPFDCETI